MTMTPIELPNVACMQSTLARLFQRIANWHEQRHQRAAMRRSIADVPEQLRQDIGLDGAAAMRPARGNGRSFDHHHVHDEIPRQWGL